MWGPGAPRRGAGFNRTPPLPGCHVADRGRERVRGAPRPGYEATGGRAGHAGLRPRSAPCVTFDATSKYLWTCKPPDTTNHTAQAPLATSGVPPLALRGPGPRSALWAHTMRLRLRLCRRSRGSSTRRVPRGRGPGPSRKLPGPPPGPPTSLPPRRCRASHADRRDAAPAGGGGPTNC